LTLQHIATRLPFAQRKAEGVSSRILAPPRTPSPKWHELIKKVWEAKPLFCPKFSCEMRIVALIDKREVIERVLSHHGLLEASVRDLPAGVPPEPGELPS
jgi:hypothetical protein